ncbi:MAG: IS66 family transposase [Sulfuricaulis sp.]
MAGSGRSTQGISTRSEDAFGQYHRIVHARCLAHARRKFVEMIQTLTKPLQSQSEANCAVLLNGKLMTSRAYSKTTGPKNGILHDRFTAYPS